MLTTWAAWVLANTLLFFLINWSQVNWYLRYLCYFFPLAVFIRWASPPYSLAAGSAPAAPSYWR